MIELEMIVKNAELFKRAMVIDCAIYVIDLEGTIQIYIPADETKVDASKFQPGVKMPEKSPAVRCLRSKKPCTSILPPEVLGESVKSYAYPVFGDTGEIIGVIGTSITMDIQDTLMTSAQHVASVTEEVSASTEELSATAAELANILEKVKEGGEKVMSHIEQTDNILMFVNNVASNSNLLGLNAAIEASRAGEHGLGFAVVADEIRKMAKESTQAVNEIKKILQSISKESIEVVEIITKASKISNQQANVTEEIGQTIISLASAANDVEKIVERL